MQQVVAYGRGVRLEQKQQVYLAILEQQGQLALGNLAERLHQQELRLMCLVVLQFVVRMRLFQVLGISYPLYIIKS